MDTIKVHIFSYIMFLSPKHNKNKVYRQYIYIPKQARVILILYNMRNVYIPSEGTGLGGTFHGTKYWFEDKTKYRY